MAATEQRQKGGTLPWGWRGKGLTARLVQLFLPKACALQPLKQWLSSAHSTLPSPLPHHVRWRPSPLALTSPQLRSAAPCEASRLPRHLARQACEFSTSETRASRAALMRSSTTSLPSWHFSATAKHAWQPPPSWLELVWWLSQSRAGGSDRSPLARCCGASRASA